MMITDQWSNFYFCLLYPWEAVIPFLLFVGVLISEVLKYEECFYGD